MDWLIFDAVNKHNCGNKRRKHQTSLTYRKLFDRDTSFRKDIKYFAFKQEVYLKYVLTMRKANSRPNTYATVSPLLITVIILMKENVKFNGIKVSIHKHQSTTSCLKHEALKSYLT